MNPLDKLPNPSDGLISINDIADAFCISVRSLSRAISQGAFPNGVVKRGRGRLRYIHRADIETALLNSRFPRPLKR